MKRTKQELSGAFMNVIESQSEDDIANFLEDINDSYNDDYDDLMAERDALLVERDDWKTKAESYRDKYINRFYDDYNSRNSKGYVHSSAPQEEIEDAEVGVKFEDLFE